MMWGMSREFTEEDWQRLADFLLLRMEHVPRTKAEILRDSGLSQGTLDDYLSGRARTKHRPDKLRDLIVALGFTPDSGERVLRGEEPILTAVGHGGSEGWPIYLEQKYDHAMATSNQAIALAERAISVTEEVLGEIVSLKEEVRQLREGEEGTAAP